MSGISYIGDHDQDNGFEFVSLSPTQQHPFPITEIAAASITTPTARSEYRGKMLTILGIFAAFAIIAALAILLPKYLS